jgi:hypothetical protein
MTIFMALLTALSRQITPFNFIYILYMYIYKEVKLKLNDKEISGSERHSRHRRNMVGFVDWQKLFESKYLLLTRFLY